MCRDENLCGQSGRRESSLNLVGSCMVPRNTVTGGITVSPWEKVILIKHMNESILRCSLKRLLHILNSFQLHLSAILEMFLHLYSIKGIVPKDCMPEISKLLPKQGFVGWNGRNLANLTELWPS